MTAFREIHGLRQPAAHERRRWFQSPFFDLFVRQAAEGEVQWFQLAMAGALVPDGLLPYLEVIEKLEATDGLPAAVRASSREQSVIRAPRAAFPSRPGDDAEVARAPALP